MIIIDKNEFDKIIIFDEVLSQKLDVNADLLDYHTDLLEELQEDIKDIKKFLREML